MRGKNARKSTARDAAVAAAVAPLEQRIQNLRNENTRLEETLDEERGAHEVEYRRLAGLVADGVTPEMLALDEKNTELRAQVKALRREVAELREARAHLARTCDTQSAELQRLRAVRPAGDR